MKSIKGRGTEAKKACPVDGFGKPGFRFPRRGTADWDALIRWTLTVGQRPRTRPGPLPFALGGAR